MNLKDFLTATETSVSATIEGDAGVDYRFTFSVVDGEIQCVTDALVAGHEMGVALGRETELAVFDRLSEQMGDIPYE